MKLFENHGAHVLVDGQYGSTGKGVLAAWLASQQLWDARIEAVICNAGPNSGHTFYNGDEKHVLKQLPTFAVASYLLGYTIPIYLSAGAIIDPIQLAVEAERYPDIPIYVHPNAAVITHKDKDDEKHGSIAAVAGTRSGTGAALARKIHRDPSAVYGGAKLPPQLTSQSNVSMRAGEFHKDDRVFIEVSQGFSLGLNQPFYPKVTSRECTVAQALSDAGITPRALSKVYMSCRTYPIRVGNVDGHSSGDWYPDQTETDWATLGVEPELTTVTQRIRRVATWSDEQFLDACRVNDPDWVFINFLNYLDEEEFIPFIRRITGLRDTVGKYYRILGGLGPKSEDVRHVRIDGESPYGG